MFKSTTQIEYYVFYSITNTLNSFKNILSSVILYTHAHRVIN